jgi:hypothetical protein
MQERRVEMIGQPSWAMDNDQVELAVTVQGGHMAPVTFYRGTPAPVQPYYISPWQGEGVKTGVPVLDMLRGDFFCMPFGGGSYQGEKHPAHGESAGSTWSFEGLRKDGKVTELRLGMETTVRPGKITKRLMLVDGQNAVYLRHDLAGYSGKMCPSHHATLAVGEEPGSLRVSVAPTRKAVVVPREARTNNGNEYYCLEPGAEFTSLSRVPTIWKHPPFADLSTHPLPYGFMDLICLYPKIQRTPAWTTVVAPKAGWLWFAMRDAQVLPQTTFWMSNGGRHAAPWSGRNRCLGIEDGCACYTFGLAESAKKNALNRVGIPTAMDLSPARPTWIMHLQGVVKVPRGFDRVRTVQFAPGGVTFASASGKKVGAPLCWEFLHSGEISG